MPFITGVFSTLLQAFLAQPRGRSVHLWIPLFPIPPLCMQYPQASNRLNGNLRFKADHRSEASRERPETG